MKMKVKKVKVLVTQSCLTLCNPMDSSQPGSSVHGIFQAKILEWVAISFSMGSSPWVSHIVGRLYRLPQALQSEPIFFFNTFES